MRIFRPIVVATLIVTPILAAPAWSQGTPEQRRSCTPDAFRLCSSFIPDVDRITACLVSHQQDLSEACASVMSVGTSRPTGSAASPERTYNR